MMKNLLLTVCCISGIIKADAQFYYQVTALPGTHSVGNNTVTVTPSGNASIFTMGWCGAAPYYIGECGAIPPVNTAYYQPGSYTFSFAAPVASVRFQITGINTGEVISFSVNGNPYTLTNANLTPFPGTCPGNLTASVVAGNIEVTGTSTIDGQHAEVNIAVSCGITEVNIHANGYQFNSGFWIIGNGSLFNFFFGGVEACSNGPVCEGDTIKLYGITGSDLSSTTFSWSGPGGFSSTLQNPVIPHADMSHAGRYILTVSTPGGSITDTVVVDILPNPPIFINFDSPVCIGKDLQLSVSNFTPGSAFLWTGPDSFSSTLTAPLIQQIKAIQEGIYTVTAHLTNGCIAYAEQEITIAYPSIHNFTDVFCSNESYRFNNRYITSAGKYTDTLTADNGCDSIVTVHLVPLPVPQVQILPETNPSSLCLGDTVSLAASGATYYHWHGVDGMANGDAFSAYLSQQDNSILVEGTSDNQCKDTAVLHLAVPSCCYVFVPNAFSPNNDGLNDLFGAESKGNIPDFKMQIFNRFGQNVFTSFSIGNHWDGAYKGIPAATGTYYYYISGECLDGTSLHLKGDLTLVR